VSGSPRALPPSLRAALVTAVLAGLACQRVKVNIGHLACVEPASGAADPGWNCGAGCFVDPATPAGATTSFGGAPAPASQPRIVYPLDGPMVPVNLAPLTFQWQRDTGATQTLFRIRLAGGARDYDFYVPYLPPPPSPTPPPLGACVYTLPEAPWRAITAENPGGELRVTIAATDGRNGPVTTSGETRLRLSPEPVRGGLYYLSTMFQGLYRLPFGARRPQAFIAPTSDANRFECAGCHAVSRDGAVIAFAAGYAGYLTVAPTDAPDRASVAPPDPPISNGHLSALNRDGSLVLSSFGVGDDRGQLAVRDTNTGAVVATLDPAVLGLPGGKVFFPDWSPDGSEIVATIATMAKTAASVYDGSIAVFPYNGGHFGAARVLVAASSSLFHYAPTWSPDGAWILFVSAPPGVASQENAGGRLRLVKRDGSALFELGRATGAAERHVGWPRFAPFAQRSGQLLFFTFNAKMDYGYLLVNRDEPTPYPQLWMAAIDLDRLGDPDPSTAPVWLPFQNLRENNLQATWAEGIPCAPGLPEMGCGPDATCTGGVCVPCGH
jgi:hypothetical protein